MRGISGRTHHGLGHLIQCESVPGPEVRFRQERLVFPGASALIRLVSDRFPIKFNLGKSSWGLLVALVLLAGCARKVAVLPQPGEPLPLRHAGTRDFRAAWWAEDSTEADMVRRLGVEKRIDREPEAALRALYEDGAWDRKDDAVCLAGLTLRHAREVERASRHRAACGYLTAAALAYPRLGETGQMTNLATIKAVRIYNDAVLGLVLTLQSLPGGLRTNHVLTVFDRPVPVGIVAGDSDSDPGGVDQWLAADRLRQRGLARRHRLDGLGARLVSVRTNHQATPLELRQPDEGIFHASTAVIRFEPQDAPGRGGDAKLVLFNPTLTSEAELLGRSWPLAADFTIPSAMLLARTKPLSKSRWTGMVHPGETPRPHRLYMMQPYSPDRIPVVMVHGLFSTPLAWQELTNELMGDPVLGRRYQLWHYLYPTGLPYLTSAADFRDELEIVRGLLDPTGAHLASQHMIVIGHSMGGLLTRTLVTAAGDSLWNSTFAIPVSKLDPKLEQLPELKRLFYYEPKPYVKRVIFMAVPHHGSRMADGFFGKIVESRITVPEAMNRFVFDMNRAAPGSLTPQAQPVFKDGYPTSIRALSPDTPGLQALARLPSAVPFHSIIGDRGSGRGEEGSDGVVPYKSAHLPGAVSELVVPSNHRAYENPAAIAEVKRILKLHLEEQGKLSAR